jgi:hemoglobin
MDTLYDRIGPDTLKQLVDAFYDFVFANEKIAPLFKNDKEEIKEKQVLFLSQFLGGPGAYSERFGHPKMRARHMPHKITHEAKEEWLKCMQLAIDTLDQLGDSLKVELYACFPQLAEHMVNS